MGEYLVTGAGGGMGSAICRMLSGSGHRVWGVDRLPAAPGAEWERLTADITREDELTAVFDRLDAAGARLDGIVHAAGVYDLNALLEMPEADFIRDFDVNLFGMFRVNRRFAPLLRRGGRIVMISSELAPLHPLPFTGVYAVTKAAVERYAEALRMEAQLLGYRVIVVRPGAVDTDMLPVSTGKLERFVRDTSLYQCNAERFKRIVDRVEARRVPPERIARAVERALTARRPRLTYCVNRNPLLMMLNALPRRAQLWIIRRILN